MWQTMKFKRIGTTKDLVLISRMSFEHEKKKEGWKTYKLTGYTERKRKEGNIHHDNYE